MVERMAQVARKKGRKSERGYMVAKAIKSGVAQRRDPSSRL